MNGSQRITSKEFRGFHWNGGDSPATAISRGANLNVRCRLPGHYERPDEVFAGTYSEHRPEVISSAANFFLTACTRLLSNEANEQD